MLQTVLRILGVHLKNPVYSIILALKVFEFLFRVSHFFKNCGSFCFCLNVFQYFNFLAEYFVYMVLSFIGLDFTQLDYLFAQVT